MHIVAAVLSLGLMSGQVMTSGNATIAGGQAEIQTPPTPPTPRTPPAPPTPPTQPAPPRQIGERASTDQTVSVQKGMRIDMVGMSACTGLITVRTWGRDAVRVRATHNSRVTVQATIRDQVVLIRTSSRGPSLMDYELTVPEWVGFSAGGVYCSVDIEGLSGPVAAETVEGDLDVRNVSGTVTLKSVEGDISIDASRGRLQISSIEGDVTVRRSSGEVVVETTDGDVQLTGMQATALEATTVDGNILFEGTLAASGRYLLTAHDGDISVGVPESSNATIAVRSFDGGPIRSTLNLKTVSSDTRGRRATYTLGNGSAQLQIETFDGSVSIHRPGESSESGRQPPNPANR